MRNVKNQSFLFPILLCSTLLITACAPATVKQFEARGKTELTKEQIRSSFSGKEIHLEAADFDANVQFGSSGKLSGTSINGSSDNGNWNVAENNLLCLKWDSWYFGDNKCYQTFKDEDNRFIFFTQNGARYYTATVTNQSSRKTTSSRHKNKQNTSQDDFQLSSERSPTTSNSNRDPDRILRLARNCPGCNLSHINFKGAQLVGANLSGADLSGSDFSGADLRRANLTNANLSGARFIRTNLPGADLTDSNLTNADLRGSNLTRAIVHGANFTGTITKGAILNSLQGTID
ncbi:MAG: pentapeptide repeat-containing protein [Desulfobulbaceae bacterium]|nr:pentapeptide repeat-containing protein [Desulfobulbaceae bacterium]